MAFAALPAPWAEVCEACTVVMKAGERRGFWMNATPGDFIARVVEHVTKAAPSSADRCGDVPVPCQVHRLWAPKDGNSDDEYEDASAGDASMKCLRSGS